MDFSFKWSNRLLSDLRLEAAAASLLACLVSIYWYFDDNSQDK